MQGPAPPDQCGTHNALLFRAPRPPMPRRPHTDTATPGLSRERILAAALALIDAHGVERFSVRDLARSLHVYPTALYWYVPSRNALVAGAVALALADLPLPDPAGEWTDELRRLLTHYRAAVQRHPHIAPVLGAQLVSNEGANLALVDRLLALLEGAGFQGPGLRRAYNTVIAGLVGFVTLELAPLPDDDPAGWSRAQHERLARLSPEQGPTLARHLPALANQAFILRWSNGQEQPLDEDFATWVEVLIQGLTAVAKLGTSVSF